MTSTSTTILQDHVTVDDPIHPPVSSSCTSDLSTDVTTDCRELIDQEVYSWVLSQQSKNKVLSSNQIRQKAYEIGQRYDQYFKASMNWFNKWKKKVQYEEQPEIDALRNRKRAYTAAFKLHAVQRSSELLSISQASLELNVSRRCLQRWKDEVDLISSVAEQASNAVYRRPGQGRKVTDSTLDIKLVEWLEGAWNEGQQITSSLVRQKAKELSANPDFKASLGWFMKWQKRHNVNLKEHTLNSPLKVSPSNDYTPLKLRLLPDGQQCAYSEPRLIPTRKRKRVSGGEGEGEEERGGREEENPLIPVQQDTEKEFDRLLLTWLVECWDSTDVLVTEKMVRDKASQLCTSSEFRPTKLWLVDWLKKYNISLERRTFGIGGETEGEIVEETPVYDDTITVAPQERALTPTKEEAATALASLASEDSSGLEIAEALQKLASAFGLNQDGTSKESMVQQLAVLSEQINSQQSDVPTDHTPSLQAPFLLDENMVQLRAEDVISEEIITDDSTVYEVDSSSTSTVQVVLNDTQAPPIIPNHTHSSYPTHVPIMTSIAYHTEVCTSPEATIVTTGNIEGLCQNNELIEEQQGDIIVHAEEREGEGEGGNVLEDEVIVDNIDELIGNHDDNHVTVYMESDHVTDVDIVN